MIYLLVFIFGLCIGSFINVLIYREKEDGRSWFKGRSFCDHCHKKLYWYDNIPLISYILLRGRCRFCNKKISFQYPLVEFITGIEFVWIYFLISQNINFFSQFEGFYSFVILLLWMVIGASLLAVLISDWKYQLIPDSAIMAGITAGLIKIWADYRYTGMIDFSVFLSGILAAIFFVFLIIITKGKGMGWGDVKLGLFMGLILGFPKIVIAIFIAFLTGALAGVILILQGSKNLKSKIAFGPYLIFGFIAALLYGNKIWEAFF